MSYASVLPPTIPFNKPTPIPEDGSCILPTLIDPFEEETFLLGPLRTLSISTTKQNELGDSMISIHDLVESYDVLSSRIESQAPRLEALQGVNKSAEVTCLGLNAIRIIGSQRICASIRRDISYALHSQSEIDAYLCGEATMKEGHACIKDRSDVCHSALRLLANIFRYSILFESFKAHELSWMFRLILNIGLSDNLMTLNAGKTYAFVIWIIHSQRLGTNIFRMFVKDIGRVLAKAIKGQMKCKISHTEGLQTIRDYLILDGSLFLPEFREVFSATLQNLVSPFSDYRQLAARALTAFSYAMIHSPPPLKTRVEYSRVVGAFIDKEEKSPLAKINKKNRASDNFVLRDFLHTDNRFTAVMTTLNISASLILLSGPYVFTRPQSIKFLLKAIDIPKQHPTCHELTIARRATWTCLLRSYSLISTWNIKNEIADENSVRQLISQEHSEDISIHTLAAFLSSQGDTCHATRYLLILSEIGSESDTVASILQRLLGHILTENSESDRAKINFDCIIPSWLLLGSSIGLKLPEVKDILAPKIAYDCKVIRNLDTEELLTTWDALVQTFQNIVINFLSNNTGADTLPKNISDMWTSLLKVQTTLETKFSLDEVSKPILSRLVTLFLELLKSPQSSKTLRPSQALLSSLQLWTSIKAELGRNWAAALAGASYRRLLLLWRYDISNGKMCPSWSQLSHEFITAAPNRSLQVLSEIQDNDVQREVWLDTVLYLQNLKQPPSPEVLIQILLFPVAANNDILTEGDMQSWRDMLSLSLEYGDPSIILTDVGNALRLATTNGPHTGLQKYFINVLEYATLHGAPENACLFETIGLFLSKTYPPNDSKKFNLLELLSYLERYIQSGLSLDSIKLLQAGFVPWFEDIDCNIDDTVYSNEVLSLYVTILIVLKKYHPIEEVFISLESLLCSPFARSRIPEPGVGPLAFKSFWDHSLPMMKFTKESFPPCLMDCIMGLTDAYGGVIPDWIEVGSESQASILIQKKLCPTDNRGILSVNTVSQSFPDPFDAHEVVPDTSFMRTPKAKTSPLLDNFSNEDHIPTPLASPSLGRSTQQFSKYLNRNPASEFVLSLDDTRSKKRRRVQAFLSVEPVATGSDKDLDDYESWEIPISSQDIQKMNEGHSLPEEQPLEAIVHKSPTSAIDHDRVPSPTAGQRLPQSMQSQTVLSNRGKNLSERFRAPHPSTTIDGIGAFQKFRSAIQTDAAQMQTQDLADAQNVIHEIAGILNSEINKKLENKRG